MTEDKNLAHFHLPGLFEFYEFYKIFLPLFLNTESIFMNGVTLVLFMVLLQIAFGVVDELDLEIIFPKKFLR